jgi:indole-3-glycerol phosphate synthase
MGANSFHTGDHQSNQHHGHPLLFQTRHGENVSPADRRIINVPTFSDAIRDCRNKGRVPLIFDIKPVSPRDGDLLRERKPADLARLAEEAGACAVSVVTEAEHFGGSVAMLREVVLACSLPVLQKDFFAAASQVRESCQAGASAVLIIMANTSDTVALSLYLEAQRLGMEAVVEVHTLTELKRALKLNPSIIGINNRDILRLETDAGDVGVTEMLVSEVPEGILTISESSLRSRSDIRRAIAANADAVLIGTAILQADDLQGLVGEWNIV